MRFHLKIYWKKILCRGLNFTVALIFHFQSLVDPISYILSCCHSTMMRDFEKDWGLHLEWLQDVVVSLFTVRHVEVEALLTSAVDFHVFNNHFHNQCQEISIFEMRLMGSLIFTTDVILLVKRGKQIYKTINRRKMNGNTKDIKTKLEVWSFYLEHIECFSGKHF